MLTREKSFARYSRTFCWILAAIWLVLGVFLLSADRSSEVLTGVLWLIGAVVFFVTGIYLPKGGAQRKRSSQPATTTESQDSDASS